MIRFFLTTSVISVLATIGLPVQATAEPFSCDNAPLVQFFGVEDAAACTSSIIWVGHHDGHLDCIYVDYTFRHGC